MIYDFLYSFGLGVSFMFGIASGVIIAGSIARVLRQEVNEQYEVATKRCEDRLNSSAQSMARIADILETMCNNQR